MQVTQEYIDGIREGRAIFKKDGGAHNAAEYIKTLIGCVKLAGGSTPVGQFHRGELDFWRKQQGKAA